MRVLVTGGSGFIGTNLIEYLMNIPDVQIMNIDKQRPKIENQLSYWKNIDILTRGGKLLYTLLLLTMSFILQQGQI